MLGALIPRVSIQVSQRIEKMRLSHEVVAREANVGVCFIRDMRSLSFEDWRKIRLQKQLLRLLKFLKLRQESNRVKVAIRESIERKKVRVKFDRRQGGKILARGRI